MVLLFMFVERFLPSLPFNLFTTLYYGTVTPTASEATSNGIALLALLAVSPLY